MKKPFVFLLIMASLFSFDSYAQIRANKDLIGKWEANGLRIEFFADGRVGLIMQGGTMPGATYKTDFFKTPASLDITVTDNRQKVVYKSFITFRDNNTIEMQGYNENDPAAAFMKGRTILLKKAK
jgi:hypothetical protein